MVASCTVFHHCGCPTTYWWCDTTERVLLLGAWHLQKWCRWQNIDHALFYLNINPVKVPHELVINMIAGLRRCFAGSLFIDAGWHWKTFYSSRSWKPALQTSNVSSKPNLSVGPLFVWRKNFMWFLDFRAYRLQDHPSRRSDCPSRHTRSFIDRCSAHAPAHCRFLVPRAPPPLLGGGRWAARRSADCETLDCV